MLPAFVGYGAFCKVLIISGDFLRTVATVPISDTVATLEWK